MGLRLHDTLRDETVPFEPLEEGRVGLYLCGPTTSDPPHVGHARTYVHTDVLHRWLEYLGYEVRRVENFTDVNHKIVARIGEDGDDEADVARRYVGEFLSVVRALNVRRADVYPRVSEHVPEIVDLVEGLIERGYAYEADGSVYFDVAAFEDYGALSKQDTDELEPQEDGERGEKRNPADFALWKAGGPDVEKVAENRHDDADALPAAEAVEGALTWDSPWGEGRPGWHVECSAMSTTHLGQPFDVHVAGSDLVFPHNENEIAQSEAAGERFSNYWLHTGMVRVDDEKMSSSLRNFTTAAEAVDEFGPDVLRTFFVSTVYSADPTYSEETMAEATERWERLERGYDRAVEAVDGVDAYATVTDESLRTAIADARESFEAAMNDDLNTREAMAALLELPAAVHEHLDGRERYDYEGLKRAVDAFEELGGDVLGLSFGAGAERSGGQAEIAAELIELVLEIREAERAAGNYERADELRDELAALGVEVQDTDEGPSFRL